jgi:hypothetical protein
VEVDSASTSRTESRVPSPLSVTGENTIDNDLTTVREEIKAVPFKNPLYEVSEIKQYHLKHILKTNYLQVKRASKKRIWKGLRQILSHERSLPWGPEAVLCKN